MTDGMRQYAPNPEQLAILIKKLRYKEGWRFSLEDIERDHESVHGGVAGGLTFVVYALTQDAYHPEQKRGVLHYFPVPAATYDERSWRRWLLNRLIDIETHEACEFMRFEGPSYSDGVISTRDIVIERPFAPNHGPGRDPYTIFDYATDEDQRTSFKGETKARQIAVALTPGAD